MDPTGLEMTAFRDMKGTVYILANLEAGRVKVGMTINSPELRLKNFNDIWWGKKVTCQVCGDRVFNMGMRIKKHRAESRDCPGGGQLPIERDVALAEAHLNDLERRARSLSGNQRSSVTRKINKLKERIERYRYYEPPVGDWSINTTFITESAERVEQVAHERLADHLDTDAPFGEVFRCSPSDAKEAIVAVLSELGLLESARKEAPKPSTLSGYGCNSKIRPIHPNHRIGKRSGPSSRCHWAPTVPSKCLSKSLVPLCKTGRLKNHPLEESSLI
jgi:hypothetical protein